MFRTIALRTAARAATATTPRTTAARTLVSVAKPSTSSSAFRVALPKMGMGVRMYSAAAGLDKTQVEGRIMSLLQGFDKVNDNTNIKATAHFANDLGLDSLDTVEVVMAIEEEFSIEIPDKDADGIHSIEQATEYILSQPDAS